MWHTLCASASAASISSHGDGLLEFLYILEVLDSSFEFPAVDGLGSLSGVLEADSEVAATASCRFGAFNAAGGSVADLRKETDFMSACYVQQRDKMPMSLVEYHGANMGIGICVPS